MIIMPCQSHRTSLKDLHIIIDQTSDVVKKFLIKFSQAKIFPLWTIAYYSLTLAQIMQGLCKHLGKRGFKCLYLTSSRVLNCDLMSMQGLPWKL